MPEKQPLETLREKAARARWLASEMSDPVTIKNLAEYAAILDREAEEIERQQPQP